MRSTILWVLRHLVVPVGLIWATGIFSVLDFKSAFSNERSDLYMSFTKAEYALLEMTPQTIRAYGDSLYSVRQQEIKTTGRYKPDDYFHDLKQYNMFEALYREVLDTSTEGRMIILGCLSSFGGQKGKFVNLRDENWSKKGNNDGFEKARAKWFPEEAVRDMENLKHPFSWKTSVFKPVLGWFMRVYLRGLPFAFLMLLFWRVRFKEENGKSMAFLPSSFLTSLLFWPLVLADDLHSRFKEMLRGAELMSRRESMLSLFSKSDEKLMEIGKKMTRKEFKTYLDSIGQVRRHFFVKVLVVTLLLGVFLPKTASFASSYTPQKGSYITEVHIVPYHDTGPAHSPPCASYEAVMPHVAEQVFEQRAKHVFHFPETIGRVLTGFILELRSVPKGLVFSLGIDS